MARPSQSKILAQHGFTTVPMGTDVKPPPLVEADPDCSVAMDILSYALYHENNHNVAKVSDDEETSGRHG